MAVYVACPKCNGQVPILPHDSAHCATCFLTFRPSNPSAAYRPATKDKGNR